MPDELLEKLENTVLEARGADASGDAREAYDRYASAIACALALNHLLAEGLVKASYAYTSVETLSQRLFSECLLIRPQDPVLSVAFSVASEAIRSAIRAGLDLEAYSMIEVFRTWRLFAELSTAQAEAYGVFGASVPRSDFGRDGLRFIFDAECRRTAMLCFYISSSLELHAFSIRQEAGELRCRRELILRPAETRTLSDQISAYGRALVIRDMAAAEPLLEAVLALLGDRLGSQLAELSDYGIEKLILSPYGVLHQLPLHALPLLPDRQPLLTQFSTVVYSPSLALYAQITADKNTDLWTWRALGYFDLENVRLAGASLVLFNSLFRDLERRLLVGSPELAFSDFRGQTILHFHCHGLAQERDFMDSRIVLGNREITFRNILGWRGLANTSLVVLNACETGRSLSPERLLDEYYGLDGAFLARGVLNVVSTLAPVLDDAAFLLTLRLYCGMRFKGLDVGVALSDAQLWLRDGRWKDDPDVEAVVGSLLRMVEGQNPQLTERVRTAHDYLCKGLRSWPADRFNHPLYWAQWKCSGFGENLIRPSRSEFVPWA